jgi:hypothetical protein
MMAAVPRVGFLMIADITGYTASANREKEMPT